jgi:hypothetical protein
VSQDQVLPEGEGQCQELLGSCHLLLKPAPPVGRLRAYHLLLLLLLLLLLEYSRTRGR